MSYTPIERLKCQAYFLLTLVVWYFSLWLHLIYNALADSLGYIRVFYNLTVQIGNINVHYFLVYLQYCYLFDWVHKCIICPS